jgi:predicted NACHT family NTPase
MLIGEPGAGKTTLLLELARDLLERATLDDTQAIPVVFNLSSWAQKQQPLAEWLVDYATERILLRKVGNGYIFAHRLLLDHFASLSLRR